MIPNPISLFENAIDYLTGRDPAEKRVLIDRQTEHYLEIATTEEPKAPLLIGIHGLGANEAQMQSLVGVTVDRPYTYLALRGFHPHPTGGYAWFPFTRSEDGFEVDEEVLVDTLNRIDRFIAAMVDRYQADPDRVVFVGYSQGGALALSYLLKHPGRVVASIAAAGSFIPLTKAWADPVNLFGRHLFIGHGTLDPFISAGEMEEAAAFYSENGVQVRLESYRIPHVVSEAEVQDMTDWLCYILEPGR